MSQLPASILQNRRVEREEAGTVAEADRRDPVDEFCLVAMTEDFEDAANYLASNDSLQLTNEQKLQFYAYFKQATVGACNTPRPGMLSFRARAKW